MKFKAILVVVMFLLVGAAAFSQDTYYVEQLTGDNTNTGTTQDGTSPNGNGPFKTIQKGV